MEKERQPRKHIMTDKLAQRERGEGGWRGRERRGGGVETDSQTDRDTHTHTHKRPHTHTHTHTLVLSARLFITTHPSDTISAPLSAPQSH